MIALALLLIGVATAGFFSGLLLFKVKARWCTHCGATLRCLDCRHARSVGAVPR